MWDHMDGCPNQYHCASGIYLLSCLALEISGFINRIVGAPEQVKYLADDLNARDKQMPNLQMARLLNHKLIQDYPIFSQVHAGS